MRIAVAGTPAVAVPTLNALHAAGHDIAVVLTREDAPLGRKRILTPSPLAARAAELGLPILKTNRITPDIAETLLATGFELGVVVAYGGLIREPLLTRPPHGWINLHFSLLPRWRGAAPVQRALMAGDTHTGIAVFQLEAGLDTGPTYVNRPVAISPHETAGELLTRLAEDGAQDVVATVAAIAAGTAHAAEQDGEPTSAPKLTAEDARVQWQRSAVEIDAQVRGVTPEPGATTTLSGQRFKIVRGHPAAAGDDATALATSVGEPGQVVLEPDASLTQAAGSPCRAEPVTPIAATADTDTTATLVESAAAADVAGQDAVAAEPGTVTARGRSILVATGAGEYELEVVQPAGKTPMPAADWFRGQHGTVRFE